MFFLSTLMMMLQRILMLSFYCLFDFLVSVCNITFYLATFKIFLYNIFEQFDYDVP